MATRNELEFKNLKELNEFLKNKDREHIHRKNQSDFSYEKLGSKGKDRKHQHGGTPFPWDNFNGPSPLNTQSLNSNNYGQMSAQGVGSPVAGYGYHAGQMGGSFKSLWGNNEPSFNMEGGCGCDRDQKGGDVKYTRSNIEEAVSEATGDSKKSVHETLNTLYGEKRQLFGENEFNEVVDVHSGFPHGSEPHAEKKKSIEITKERTKKNQHEKKSKSLNTRRTGNQSGGNPTPMPWEWYNPSIQVNTQTTK